MANYYGLGRTNYVKMKDLDATVEMFFKYGLDIEVYKKDEYVSFSGYQSDSGVINTVAYDDDDNEIDVLTEIAKQMEDGQILVYQEAGSEKARYAVGFAIAIDSTGKQTHLSLNDIYRKAATMFDVSIDSISEAMY